MKIEDKDKTKKELINELDSLRQKVAELEKRDHDLRKKIGEITESCNKYQMIADGTFDWEFWLSPGAEFVYSSPACERIAGYAASEFANDPALFYRIIHKDDLAGVVENLNRRRVEESSCEIQFRIFHRNGTLKRISLVFHPIYEKNGQYMGIRGSNREIVDWPPV
ncbi:MAG: PAS domain-containing protein [Smithella sp.]